MSDRAGGSETPDPPDQAGDTAGGAAAAGHWNEAGDWVDEHGYVHDEHGNIYAPDGSLYQRADPDPAEQAAVEQVAVAPVETDLDEHLHEHSGGPPDDWDDSPLAPAPRGRRRGRQPARGARRLVVLLVALGLVAGAGLLGLSVLRPMIERFGASASDYPGPGGQEITFTVNDGDTGRVIAGNLARADIVASSEAFVEAAQADSRSAGIQPGDYVLRRQMKATDALAILVDPKNRANPKVTVREGLWAREIYPVLAKATGHAITDYEAAAKDLAALGVPAGAHSVEGWLFPATYEFSDKQSATEQLSAMVAKTKAELTRLGIPPDRWLRTLNVASIVEAEVNRADDRPKAARVVENRLARPMRLQMDSTVNYGTGKHNITTTDQERATPTPWNTYQKDGLPDTPIGNPGTSAIQAAAAPAEGPWFYFVATNPEFGQTEFAVTLEEHNRNVAAFRAWCQAPANQGKCSR